MVCTVLFYMHHSTQLCLDNIFISYSYTCIVLLLVYVIQAHIFIVAVQTLLPPARPHDKTGGGRVCNFHSLLYVRAEYFLRIINRHFR